MQNLKMAYFLAMFWMVLIIEYTVWKQMWRKNLQNIVFDEVKANKGLVVDYDEDEDIVHIKDMPNEDNQKDEETSKRMELEFHRDQPKKLITESPSYDYISSFEYRLSLGLLSNIELKNFKQAEKRKVGC